MEVHLKVHKSLTHPKLTVEGYLDRHDLKQRATHQAGVFDKLGNKEIDCMISIFHGIYCPVYTVSCQLPSMSAMYQGDVHTMRTSCRTICLPSGNRSMLLLTYGLLQRTRSLLEPVSHLAKSQRASRRGARGVTLSYINSDKSILNNYLWN